ncbi:MAG TPA: beta-galactosidase, partial [Candidatus Acidoferrales bacterium]|nr:beta-galactosidase [Candidatus Acidoferrales bacterium]
GQAPAQTPRPFLHPERIHYDRQCLTIDGKDTFIYSGAFHYFRCPKELWADRFEKIKAAGFNCVETYVAWNQCEPRMPSGTNDFSKVNLKDLDDWLTLAEQKGLYVIVRPGPYICAEWATGGFPEWLLTKKPADPLRSEGWLRSDDPVFLAWSRHWYDAVCPVIAKHQITRKTPGDPGVILMQVENEYDYASFPDEAKINHVKALAEAALANGIDVPLITCWTHQVRGSKDPVLRRIFDCCNFYPRWNVEHELRDGIGKLRAEQPDAPLGTTELQGGWFAQVGGKLSEQQDGVTAAQINNITLFAIQNGDTLMNYYMLFGGSNLGDWAARDLTTTYDYNAPIREWGGIGDRYQRVWAIGHMLQAHGPRLARAEVVDCDVKTTQDDVSVAERRAPDGSRYFFVRTSEHRTPREGTATVKEKAGEAVEVTFAYQLEPFGAKILYLPPGVTDAAQGEWLPKPAPAIERPTKLPAAVAITSVRMHADTGPSHWTKLKPAETLPEAGAYGSGFIFYRASVTSETPTNLWIEYPGGDAVVAAINGEPAARVGGTAARSVFALAAGMSKLELLYENRGFVNGGRDMERPGGISAARLVNSTNLEGNPITGWKMHEVNGTRERPEVKTDFDDSDWPAVAVDKTEADQLTPDKTAVFRAAINVTADDLKDAKWKLSFERIDDAGWIYLNGKRVGQTTDWSRAYSFDVTKQLRAGKNIVAVIVRNNEGAGGLGGPVFGRAAEGAEVPLAAFGNPAGVERGWWQPRFEDSRWKQVTLGADSQGGESLTWYRMSFQLPATQPDVWVPWHVHLDASGNGFLYLNGHAIGRYWQAGPQHDFFLPECWLNFGGNKDNNLTLDLRPVDGPTRIETAAVEPYAGFAEKR